MVRFTLTEDDEQDNGTTLDALVRDAPTIDLGELRIRSCKGYDADRMANVLEYRLMPDKEKQSVFTEAVRQGLDNDWNHVVSCDNCTSSYREMRHTIVTAMKNGLNVNSSNAVMKVFRYVTSKGLSLFDLKKLWAPQAAYN